MTRTLALICALCSTTAIAQPTTDLELAKELGKRLELCRANRKLDVEAAATRCLILLDAARSEGKIRTRACEDHAAADFKLVNTKLTETHKAWQQAEKAAVRQWWENPTLLVGAGVVAGVAVGVGAVVFIRQ